ncbi:MAG: nucleoid occlusion factor SlmA [Pseudomonadota bacterium]
MKKESRKQHILECLAHMLEDNPGGKITTAKLAAEVGVSEAALYRHFPSKTKMFEGLIEFMEGVIFSRINLIIQEEEECIERCYQITYLLLKFTEQNPGITRLLTGDILAGETPRLRERIAQFYDRVEMQLKNILREAEIKEHIRPIMPMTAAANLLLMTTDGHIHQYVRSNFKRKPTEYWEEQWPILIEGFFKRTMGGVV